MRLRNIPNADKILNESDKTIKSSKDFFVTDKQLEIEIGMGKGDFIITHAINRPEVNFIGIEKYPSVQLIALNKLNKMNENLSNLKLWSIDAFELNKELPLKSVDKIYLNFSDPWPKKKHLKRRLTYSDFLRVYFDILKPQGIIEIKTDQKPFYNSTFEQLENFSGFKLVETSLDLHRWKTNVITTEYEKKFIEKGNPIFYIKLIKNQ